MIRWPKPTPHVRTLWGPTSASMCREWSVPAARGRRSAEPRNIARGGGCRGRLCPVCGARQVSCGHGGGRLRGGRQRFEPTPISWGEAALSEDTRSLFCLILVLDWSRGFYSPSPGYSLSDVVARPFAGTGRPLSGTSLSAWGTDSACMHSRVLARARAREKERKRESPQQKLLAEKARRGPRRHLCSEHSSPRVAPRGRDDGRVRSGHGLAAGRRSRGHSARPQHHRHGLGVCCSCCL